MQCFSVQTTWLGIRWDGKELEELLLGKSSNDANDNKIDNLGQEADAEISIPGNKIEIENLAALRHFYRNQQWSQHLR